MKISFSGGERLSATKLNGLSQAIESATPFPSEMIRTPRGSHPYKNREFIQPPPDWIKRFRFEIYQETLKVNGGTFTRNGIEVTKTDTTVTGEGNDVDGYASAFTADTKYYLWLELYNTDLAINPAVTPSGVKIVCDKDKPTAADLLTQKYVLLGEFETNTNKIVKPESIVRYWINDINDFYTDNGFNYKRFRVDYASATTVLCNAGNWTRNGIVLTKVDTVITGVGNDIDGFAVGFAGNSAFYVYLLLNSTSGYIDPCQEPNRFKLVCDDGFPAETPNKNIAVLLAGFTTDVGGNINKSSIVWYWIGDIDDINIIPDTELVPQTSTEFKSIAFNHDSIHQLEIHGFHDASNTDPTTGALWLYREGNEVRYANNAAMAGIIAHDSTSGAGDSSIHDDHIEELLEDYIFDGNVGGVSMVYKVGTGTSAGLISVGSTILISKSAVSAIDLNQAPTATESVDSWLANIKAGDIIRVFSPAYFNMHNGVTYSYVINQVGSITDSGTYYTISCTTLASSGTISSGLVLFSYSSKGNVGATGIMGSGYSNMRLEDGDAIGEKELWVTYTPAVGAPEDQYLGSIYTLPPFPTTNGQYVLEINNGAASWAGI